MKSFFHLFLELYLLLIPGYCIAQKTLVGFKSIGLSDNATPVQVCQSLPNNTIWYSDVVAAKSWRADYAFSGSVMAIKKDNKCTIFRWENTEMYVATYIKDEKSKVGYQFSGFEPVNARSQSNVRNDEIAARELVRVCESYEGNFWQYENQQHIDIEKKLKKGDTSIPVGFFTKDNVSKYKQSFTDAIYKKNNFPVIDCQTLIKLALAGISYEYSPYSDKSYQYRELNAYPWATQLPNVYLSDFADWCIKSGFEIDPGKNFENLQAGDLVFYGATKDLRIPHTRRIGHVAMYTGRWVADKGYTPEGVNGKKYNKKYAFPLYDNKGKRIGYDTISLHPQTIEVDQSPDHLPNKMVVRHRFIDEEDDGNDVTSHKLSNVVMYARIPLRTKGSWSNTNPKDNPVNMIHTSGINTGYRVDIIGNGKPIVLYIGSLNQAGNMQAVGRDVTTGFMPYSEHAYEKLPSNAKLKSVSYYNAKFEKINNPKDAVMVKHLISGTDIKSMRENYMYNGVNQYKVFNQAEQSIIVRGVLKPGENAIIDTSTGKMYTSMGSRLTIDGSVSDYPGMKVVVCPTGQECFVTWE